MKRWIQLSSPNTTSESSGPFRTSEAHPQSSPKLGEQVVVAHDVLNQLSLLLLHLNRSIDSLEESHSTPRHHLRMAIQNAESAAHLCRAVLRPRRIGGSWQSFDITDVVKSSVGSLQVTSPFARISTEFAHCRVMTRGDRNRVHRIVTNLVLNALQSLKDGQGTVKVTTLPDMVIGGVTLEGEERVEGLADGCYLRLSVEDDGEGIPQQILHKLEENTVVSTKEGGNGVGVISITSTVAELGGVVIVRSEPGSGSRFCVLLPGRVAPSSEVAA